jgi:hypothetical protein
MLLPTNPAHCLWFKFKTFYSSNRVIVSKPQYKPEMDIATVTDLQLPQLARKFMDAPPEWISTLSPEPRLLKPLL